MGLDRIDRSIQQLEEAHAGLILLERRLQQEKLAYKLANYDAMVRLILLRLNGGQPDLGPIPSIPSDIGRQIDVRLDKLKGIHGQGAPSPQERDGAGERDLSSEERDTLRRMREGDYRWQPAQK